jgi:hypothetical protein
MIEPTAFCYNEQTAENNFFQHNDEMSVFDTQNFALTEFRETVEKLRATGIRVIVEKDTFKPHTPDSIFPNNWISFHEDGSVILYPMFAENRRAERRIEILQRIEREGFKIKKIIDYSFYEKENRFLEGTGSLVLDRKNRIAYAALSQRTDKEVLRRFCDDNKFAPVVFSAFQTVDEKRLPVYHTNVMMCVGETFAVVCLQSIDNKDERERIVQSLLDTKKEIIEITESQMSCFAGNMLQINNRDGEKFLAMSETAFSSLNVEQIKQIGQHSNILRCNIPTIETVGGGGIRCMMSEIFLIN